MTKRILVLLLLLTHFCFAQELFNEKTLIENLRFLSSDSMKGRKPESKESAAARALIKTQFKNLGLQSLGNDFELPFDFTQKTGEKVKGVNVAGLFKGSGKSGKSLVITAHYDHVGVKDGKIYNGADDNASGTSALIALAEFFKINPPQHDIVFVAFDAEEMGLQGAKAFVKNPPVPVENIVANINMDMVARADNNELVACGIYYYPQLKPMIEKVGNPEKVKIVFGHDDPAVYKGSDNWTFSSDHGPFHSAKIPFVYFGVADHADYHKPTDDFEKVNPETFKSVVRLIVRISQELDKGLN